MKNKKIYRLCGMCAYEETCDLKRGCRQWQCWFRAYWSALRKRHGFRYMALEGNNGGDERP